MTVYKRERLKNVNNEYIVTPSMADMVYYSDGKTVDQKFNEVESTVQNKMNDINSNFVKMDEKFTNTLKNNRKIKFNFSATPWQMSANDNTIPNSKESIDNQLTKLSKLGFDGIVVLATLKKQSNGELEPDATLENIFYYISKAKSLGLSIRCLKFHFDNSLFFESGMEDKYESKVIEITNQIVGMNIPYVCVYNEAVGYLYTNEQNVINRVTNLCQRIRSKGFKVGISGLSLTKILYDYNWLNECQDVHMPFDYRRISYKGKRTTYEDARISYEEFAKELVFFKEKLNKPIIISETGILPYWEALANPVYFNWDTAQDNSGEIQKLFFYWLFENPIFNNLLEEVWVWFPDNLYHNQAFENCSKFFCQYTRGGALNE